MCLLEFCFSLFCFGFFMHHLSVCGLFGVILIMGSETLWVVCFFFSNEIIQRALDY